jgi:hypothetical protein
MDRPYGQPQECPTYSLNIKRFGGFSGIGHRIHGDRRQYVPEMTWEYVHVAIDDHSLVAFSRILPD